MAIDLEKLNIVITGQADKAISTLDSLLEKLKELRNSTSGFDGRTLTANLNNVAASANNVAESVAPIADSLNGTTKAAGGVVDSIKGITNAALNNKRTVGIFAQTAKEVEYTGTAAKGSAREVGIFANSIHSATGRIAKFFGSFKRIATMRLMRWTIRQLVQSVREGLEILVEWDRTFGNNTSYAAKTVDELSAKWREVKKSIGAAIMPLIQILQPALEFIMNGVIAIANIFNQVLRSAQGYSDYMKATLTSTKQTVGAAKELKRVLFGFDELNVLPSDSGAGAGASAQVVEFVPTAVDSKWGAIGGKLKALADKLKAPFDMALNGIQKAFKGAALVIQGIIDGDWATVWEGFKQQFEGVKEFASGVWEGLKVLFAPVAQWLEENVFAPIRAKLDAFAKQYPLIAKLLGIKGNRVQDTIEQAAAEGKITLSVDASISKAAQGVIDLKNGANPKVKFNTDASLSTATSSLMAGVNAALKPSILIKFKTDTTLSPDTQKLIGLTSLNGINAGIKIMAGGFASGGAPEMGTLFYAGEAGAEVVANTAGGTGVMNVKQMQDAVSNGNLQVVNAIMTGVNALSNVINSKDTNTYLDGRLITDTVAKQMSNRVRATGQAVIAR